MMRIGTTFERELNLEVRKMRILILINYNSFIFPSKDKLPEN
jgi:hypothetical protein